MDDNKSFSGGVSTGKRNRKTRLRRLLAGLTTLLLVLAALLVFALRDRLSSERLRETFGQSVENTIQSEPYTYEMGSGQVFAAAGNGFAVASSSALEYLDRDGRALYKQLVSYGQPAVFASANGVLFCDLGTENLVWLDAEGKPLSLSPAGEVLTASMNARGYVALVTAEAGYKGKVTVYDATAKARYAWWSGSGYVLAARLSPDCRILAALCAEESGGKLHLFRLDSETELAAAEFPDELPFDLDFLGNDSLCAVSQEGLRFLGLDGTLREGFDFGDYFLMDYEFGESFAVCYVSAYRGGGGGFQESFSPAGELLAVKEQDRDILSLSASGRSLLAMSGGGWTVYSPELNVQRASASLLTARRALLRTDGSILLLGSYAAERVR